MTTFYTYLDSPLEHLLLTSDGSALTGVYMGEHADVPAAHPDWVQDDTARPFPGTAKQLADYFADSLSEFNVPVRLEGTSFQKQVWDALKSIPYGETVSYGEIARRIGKPSAVRAVGLAVGRNPVSIILPCHRVVGSTGGLTGYGGGLWRKQFLLELEGCYPIAMANQPPLAEIPSAIGH